MVMMKSYYENVQFCRSILLLIMMVFVNISSYSYGVYSGYVGSTIYLPGPTVNGTIYSAQWSSRETSLLITSDKYNSANVTIRSYFTGTAVVECDYYYYIGSGVNMRAGHGSISYGITCNAVTIRINNPSITLNPGQGEYISYTLSPSISPSPTVRFYSNNTNVATVNSSGYVYAVGSGTTTITVENSAGTSAYCSVTVNDVPVSGATISSSIDVNADESKSLSVSVYPSNATIRSKTWSIAEGAEYVSLTSSGTLTGKKPGTAKIYCTVNNAVKSNTATVNVYEPSFLQSGSSPANNATGVSAFVSPSATYSLALYQGNNFSDIKLKDNDSGKNVDGTVSLSGKTVTFSPSKPLNELTNYTFAIPAKALKNKWETHYKSDVNISFRTGEWEKLTLTVSQKSSFVSVGDKVTLKCNVSSARIYYTTDGTVPTEKSSLYTEAIVISKDTKLRAVAMCDGYRNSDMVSELYLITNVNVAKKFPDVDTELYLYKDVNPYITFSNGVIASTNIGGVKLEKYGSEAIEGDVIVADSSIFFVPKTPLDLGCSYQMSIPSDAIKTIQGESNNETSWSFSTGNYVTRIAMGGPELAIATKTDGTLQTWGSLYKSGSAVEGIYTMTSQLTPSVFMNEDVVAISSGYMHHAVIKKDGSLWMWGRQYCGEFGNKSTAGSANPVKVMEDVKSVSCGGQTTGVIMLDGSLWMCGRNDFGQIGDNSIVNRSEPVRILDDVNMVSVGWCATYAVKTDGTLWAWGRNDKHQLGLDSTDDQLTPVKVMDDVAIVAASATESQLVAVIKTDGTLWAWGETQPTPTMMLDGVSSVAVGADYVEAVKTDGTLWAFGNNAFGQIGNGTTSASLTPIKVMDDVAEVASGGQTTIINKQNGSVWTWGRNNMGTLGDGTTPSLTAYSSKPTQVIEGRSSSMLTGIASRKKTYQIVEGSLNVIDAIPVPLNGVYNDLLWKSLDNSIVSVTERGVIKAESLGETDVIATIKNDKGNEYSMTCHVIVTDATDINDVYTEDNCIKVWSENHLLHIDGLQAGQHVSIYGADGVLVYQGIANSFASIIPIAQIGVYVVKVDKFSKKVLVQ